VHNVNIKAGSVSSESDTFPSQGGGAPSSLKIVGTSHMCTPSIRNNNHILYGDQTAHEENFYTVKMNAET